MVDIDPQRNLLEILIGFIVKNRVGKFYLPYSIFRFRYLYPL